MRCSIPALLFVLAAAPAWSQPAADLAPVQEPLHAPTNPESPANPRRPVWAVFPDIGRDFSHLASVDTAKVLAIGGAAAAMVHPLDTEMNPRLVGDPWVEDAFAPGKLIGYGLVQGGVAVATYAWGRKTKAPKVVHIGVDLLRRGDPQAGLTYGVKAAVRRGPSGMAPGYSLPSGHASVTFASATVLQRHFRLEGCGQVISCPPTWRHRGSTRIATISGGRYLWRSARNCRRSYSDQARSRHVERGGGADARRRLRGTRQSGKVEKWKSGKVSGKCNELYLALTSVRGPSLVATSHIVVFRTYFSTFPLFHLLSCGLLLRQAVQRAEAPHEVHGVDADHLRGRERARRAC